MVKTTTTQTTENGITYEVETDRDGDKQWLLHGKRHRINGPAVEWSDGTKFWYLNDKRHRVDGPAIEGSNGSKFWYLNGDELTEEEFMAFREEVEYIKQHPEDAPLYLNHKHLNFIAKETLEGICLMK